MDCPSRALVISRVTKGPSPNNLDLACRLVLQLIWYMDKMVPNQAELYNS